VISSGLDDYGSVAEVEQTRTLPYRGCSTAARSKKTFSLELLSASPHAADSGSCAILQSVCPHRGCTWDITLLRKWYSIPSGILLPVLFLTT